MANLQGDITEDLSIIALIGKINGINISNKVKQVNLAIKIANECIKGLDEESLNHVTGLKKSF